METQKTIIKNTTYYIFALIFQRALSFVYFILLANGLGTENLGKYVFAFSFVSIFSVIADMGLSQILIREIAKGQEKNKNILSNTLSLKIFLSVIVYFLLVLIINLIGYSSIIKIMVYLAGLIMILDNFSTTWWGVMRGYENLKYESIGIIFFQTITIIVGGIFLYFKLGVMYLILPVFLGSL